MRRKEHSAKVKDAIQAALTDINLLRLLVNAKEDSVVVNAILKAYKRTLVLSASDAEDFSDMLRDSTRTMYVEDLVKSYDSLVPKPKIAKAGIQAEWEP